ncbi:hypothetical protein N271_gp59 [Salmonella phage Jersey]|uniref:Uncharacterized protein n=1 Tax=Salmonella phage Jersey TaxID=1340534 RepID=S4WZQ6_9CAUD|nr:hypothetical protein N271_gp59 [Salmonella phage Jersey]AGP24947.1 hypothetical protein Jersey_59 [Salmonella phage Jersey]
MVQRYSIYGMSDTCPDDHSTLVRYEDYAALKAHADAMCEELYLYDSGERVSFESYINYTEWLSKQGEGK